MVRWDFNIIPLLYYVVPVSSETLRVGWDACAVFLAPLPTISPILLPAVAKLLLRDWQKSEEEGTAAASSSAVSGLLKRYAPPPGDDEHGWLDHLMPLQGCSGRR